VIYFKNIIFSKIFMCSVFRTLCKVINFGWPRCLCNCCSVLFMVVGSQKVFWKGGICLSSIWHHITRWLVPGVVRHHSGLIFKGQNVKEECPK